MGERPWLKIGTRGSPLALAQACETRRLLAAAHGMPEEKIAIVVLKTTGDMILDRALSEAGGKGLFTKELPPIEPMNQVLFIPMLDTGAPPDAVAISTPFL